MSIDLGHVLGAARGYCDLARAAVAGIDPANQRAHHGFAWIATSVAALEAVSGWLDSNGGGTELDRQVAFLAFAETLGQLTGGLPMGQNELLRPGDLGLGQTARDLAHACAELVEGDHAATRAAVAAALAEWQWPSEGLDGGELDTIRESFRRFTEAEILPHAHGWHLANALIPDATVAKMAELGTFGATIPEEFGGLGLSKLVMCLITEELSRGWIGAGSLGTRSEIAGELIALGGTAAEGLLALTGTVTSMRGPWHDFEGTPVRVTYHPSYLLQSGGNMNVKRQVWEDMLAVMEKLGLPISDKQRGFFLPKP